VENAKEWVGYVHEKSGEHQRGEREADSVDGCLDSTEMVDPKNSQEKEARHEGEEKETGDLSEKGQGEAKDVKSYGTPEGEEER